MYASAFDPKRGETGIPHIYEQFSVSGVKSRIDRQMHPPEGALHCELLRKEQRAEKGLQHMSRESEIMFEQTYIGTVTSAFPMPT